MKLFLTGSTGFLGRHVRRRLQQFEDRFSIAELPRSAGADLLSPRSYERELAGADTVMHLAAATGKAPTAEHFRVNAEGTRVLLEQSRRYGVRRFVFVSTISTKFPDIRQYPYARAKLAAEAAVASSGLDYTIVRPTIIAGPGSPAIAGLRRLAVLPVVPIFGTGLVHVQPIFVDDLAQCLVSIVQGGGQIIELGGPEVITIERLLREMRRVLTGKPMRALRIPLAPVLSALEILEIVAAPFLPVTVGQLSSFRFDGTATANEVFERHRAGMTDLSQMLKASLLP
jgi:nucleoside-diphosphate-sugar epimerase